MKPLKYIIGFVILVGLIWSIVLNFQLEKENSELKLLIEQFIPAAQDLERRNHELSEDQAWKEEQMRRMQQQDSMNASQPSMSDTTFYPTTNAQNPSQTQVQTPLINPQKPNFEDLNKKKQR